MPKPIKSKRVYAFKEGQITSLDYIYPINGLFKSNWWEQVNDMNSAGGVAKGEEATQCSGETIRITRNITIEIIER